MLFGTSDLAYSAIDMTSLDASDEFEVRDTVNMPTFYEGNANGDFNGDGFNDVVFNANDMLSNATTVVFGGADLGTVVEATTLDGATGFQVTGVDGGQAQSDFVGDFNGDGFDDLLIWEGATDNGDGTTGAGVVVFGGQTLNGFQAITALDEPGVGLRLKAANVVDYTAVGIGDINGDGLGDIYVGAAPDQDDGGGVVIFGVDDSGIEIDFVNLDGADGFRVVAPVGESLNLGSTNNVAAAGDFNGDGLDDFVIGARAGGNPDNAGQVYIIFGSTSAFDATMDLDDLSFNQGFQVLNDGGGFFGQTVTGGADINGDGFDDIAIGGGENANGNEEQTVLLGQDFSGNAVVGCDGADTFTGDAYTGDRFFGGLGDDILIGAGDADVLSGGAGDDILVISDTNFVRVDGGTGDDILRIPGDSGVTLDFTQPGHEGIHSIETIDLCGVSGNFLRIRPVDVAGLSETTNKLFVTGGAADGVTLVGDSLFGDAGDAQTFAFDGVETVGGVTFNRFISGAREISIQQGIVISREVSIGDLGDESIRFLEVDGDFGGSPATLGIGTAGTLGADLNGDGLSDVLVGGPGPVNGSGVIFDIRAEELPGSGDFDLEGQDNFSFGNGSGDVVASVGDINGDGFDDYVQTQPNNDSNAGYASIEFGNAGTGRTASYDPINAQLESTAQLGRDVSGGDFNGDGIADMIIGAPRFDGAPGAESGRAYVLFGQDVAAGDLIIDLNALDGTDGLLLDGITAGTRFGQGVESLGDINGDGLDDMAIAAPF